MTPISSADLENSSLAGKCTLSSGVKIKGSITFQKELVIDGTVQGKINSNGVLTIGENGDVRGEIKAKSVTVYGKVHGTITAERCELKSKCTLEGDLKAARLIIEEGATFPLPVEWQEQPYRGSVSSDAAALKSLVAAHAPLRAYFHRHTERLTRA